MAGARLQKTIYSFIMGVLGWLALTFYRGNLMQCYSGSGVYDGWRKTVQHDLDAIDVHGCMGAWVHGCMGAWVGDWMTDSAERGRLSKSLCKDQYKFASLQLNEWWPKAAHNKSKIRSSTPPSCVCVYCSVIMCCCMSGLHNTPFHVHAK